MYSGKEIGFPALTRTIYITQAKRPRKVSFYIPLKPEFLKNNDSSRGQLKLLET